MSVETKHNNRYIIHNSIYPEYQQFDINQYVRIDGMQSLGFIAQHRPDIHIVTDLTEKQFPPDLIVNAIEQGLAQGKKVGLFFWDEDFMIENDYSQELNHALETYKNKPVYLCSNMDPECLKIYSFQRKIPIKVIHVPWWFANMIPQMIKLSSSYLGPQQVDGPQFACYVNRMDQHKEDLVNMLIDLPADILRDVRTKSVSHELNYCSESDMQSWRSSHDTKRSLIWHPSSCLISHNVNNLSKLHMMLDDIPMIVHPESTTGIFELTEKSIWPIIMARMLLVYGRPGIMQEIQQYYSLDFKSYLDLEFDSMEGWTLQDHRRRLDCMIEKNLYTLSHARDIWHDLSKEILAASTDIGAIVYQKFCESLNLIQ